MLFELSLPTLLLCSIAAFLLALEVGYRLGQRRQDKTDEPDKTHTSALQGATLGLLALLLGFTFAMAVSRFDNRKTVIVDQANAIGTAELRSRLLGTPYAEKAAPLFRDYVDAWLQFRFAGDDIAAVKAAEDRAFAIENQLWNMVRETGCTLNEAVGQCQQMLIRSALRAEGSNRTRAARRLGINVRTIYKKIVP